MSSNSLLLVISTALALMACSPSSDNDTTVNSSSDETYNRLLEQQQASEAPNRQIPSNLEDQFITHRSPEPWKKYDSQELQLVDADTFLVRASGELVNLRSGSNSYYFMAYASDPEAYEKNPDLELHHLQQYAYLQCFGEWDSFWSKKPTRQNLVEYAATQKKVMAELLQQKANNLEWRVIGFNGFSGIWEIELRDNRFGSNLTDFFSSLEWNAVYHTSRNAEKRLKDLASGMLSKHLSKCDE